MKVKRRRWQEPKYSLSGRAYLTHYGSRIYLDEVMRIDNAEDGVVGSQHITNRGGYVVRAKEIEYGEQLFSVSIETV